MRTRDQGNSRAGRGYLCVLLRNSPSSPTLPSLPAASTGHSPSISGARGHAVASGGNGSEMLEELLGPFPVVRLRGLPSEAQVRDIILFFQVSSGGAGICCLSPLDASRFAFSTHVHTHTCTTTTTGHRGDGRGDDEQGRVLGPLQHGHGHAACLGQGQVSQATRERERGRRVRVPACC